MERVADELADHASDCFARSHSPKFDVDRQTLFFNEASAYKNSAEIIRIVLQKHAMKEEAVEEQAEYGERRAICPLMSVPVEGVDCMRERCAWWTGTECAVASIAKRGRGVDVMIKPPVVPGL